MTNLVFLNFKVRHSVNKRFGDGDGGAFGGAGGLSGGEAWAGSV